MTGPWCWFAALGSCSMIEGNGRRFMALGLQACSREVWYHVKGMAWQRLWYVEMTTKKEDAGVVKGEARDNKKRCEENGNKVFILAMDGHPAPCPSKNPPCQFFLSSHGDR
ncbi:hypothetical protein GH714_006298 [Hevea brasiliensis]|uniref:Uncharacterized protein n=1 Tax=Hevea brasiliensis TaxID=3981 RepID=A0A6A6LYE6_HEVBR|nr:hypothetical protein GH714_006298 [Hevea brasiliensis]